MATLAKLPYPAVRDAIFAHPILAEGLGSLFSNLPHGHSRQRFQVHLGEARTTVLQEEVHESL
jgi:hypothetical protein